MRVSLCFVKGGCDCPQNRCVLQIPRFYAKQKERESCGEFWRVFGHLFRPFFGVNKDPLTHPDSEQFLHNVSGFDCVGDEHGFEPVRISENTPTPAEWTSADEPPHGCYLYYISANVNSLNNFRLLAGCGDPLDFHAHNGQTGNSSHLISACFLAKQICHGI